MKRKLFTGLIGTLILTAGITSCNEDNHFEYNTSSECIVTSMTMGTLKREMHTKNSKGEDSTYFVSVTGALYPMSIDQERLRIYNVDSLPIGTDVSKMIFSSMNTRGSYAIRSLKSGNDTIFKLTDSTDFSVPRIITVYASDGASKRSYQVSVNVHQEDGEAMVWSQRSKSVSVLKDLENTRSLAVGDLIYVFGEKNGISQVLHTDVNNLNNGNADQWGTSVTSTSIQPQSVVRFQDLFYAVNAEQKIFSSADGIEWTLTDSDFTASTLVMSGSNRMIALKDSQFFSTTDGINWTLDSSDEPEFMPETYATGTCIPSSTDATFETLIVVGVNKGQNVVWKREIDKKSNEEYPWVYLPNSESNPYNIPAYQHITLETYDNMALLGGLTPEGKTAPLLLSRDKGRTWKKDGLRTPEAQALNSIALTVDNQNFIWMFCGQTGEVWRGRINRLGWDNIPGTFE